jgi:hypothetical protein
MAASRCGVGCEAAGVVTTDHVTCSQLRGASGEDNDDVGGERERVGGDAAVGDGHGGDGDAVGLGQQRGPGQGALGIQGGEAAQSLLVALVSGAEGEGCSGHEQHDAPCNP